MSYTVMNGQHGLHSKTTSNNKRKKEKEIRKKEKKNLKAVFKERTIQVSPTKKMAKNKAKFQGRPDLLVPFLLVSGEHASL